MTVKELTKQVEIFKKDIYYHIEHIQHKFISTSGECEIDIKKPVESIISLSEKQAIINNFNSIFDQLKTINKELSKISKDRQVFLHNYEYIGVIKNIIEIEETQWDNKPFERMVVQLEDNIEVYNIFCSKYKKISSGDRIKFRYNADENKLMEIRKIK
jgi:hypothetical protein